MFLEKKKAGLFTKFVDTFFSVARQKSFLMYNAENWDTEKKNFFQDTAVFSGGKKRVFLLKLNYFCLQVLFVKYL